MVQPTPEVLQSHGLKKPEEYTKQELGKLMLKVHMECGVTILVNVPYADRHHKYPTKMPTVVRFTNDFWLGYLYKYPYKYPSEMPGVQFLGQLLARVLVALRISKRSKYILMSFKNSECNKYPGQKLL